MKYLTPSARTETFVQVDTIRPFSSLSFYSQYSSLIRPFSSLSFSLLIPHPSILLPLLLYSLLIPHPTCSFSSLSFYTHYSSLIRPFFLPLLLYSLLIPHPGPSSSLSFYAHCSSLIRPFSSNPSTLIPYPFLLLPLLLYSSFICSFFYTHPSSVPSPPSSLILLLHQFLLIHLLLYSLLSIPLLLYSFFEPSISFLSSNTHPSSLPLSPSPPILILNPSILLLILILLPFLLHPLPLYSSFKFISVLLIIFLLSFLYEYSFTPSSIHSFIFISLSTFLPFFNRSFFPHIPPPCF